MAITGKAYGLSIGTLINGEWDWDTDTIKMALCTSTYTPNQDTHNYFDDITNELTTGNGYTAGGATMTNCTHSYTAGTNVHKLDADDVTWSSSTITCRYAIVYKDTGTASTSPLIAYIDFGEDVGSVAGDFTVQLHADGLMTFTVA